MNPENSRGLDLVPAMPYSVTDFVSRLISYGGLPGSTLGRPRDLYARLVEESRLFGSVAQ